VVDSGLIHPRFGIYETYVVIALTNNYAIDRIESSIELITDSLTQAKLTRDAILEGKWRLGDEMPWQADRCTLRHVEIRVLTNPLLNGKM
jgi:hypothetical protein